jgi:hypothetical protein
MVLTRFSILLFASIALHAAPSFAILRLAAIPKPDDTADALAIALCHASRRKMENIRNQ